MTGFSLDREDELQKLPYDQAMQTVWLWIKSGGLESRMDFVRAIEIIQKAQAARRACSDW